MMRRNTEGMETLSLPTWGWQGCVLSLFDRIFALEDDDIGLYLFA
jgi:hypothetical protein